MDQVKKYAQRFFFLKRECGGYRKGRTEMNLVESEDVLVNLQRSLTVYVYSNLKVTAYFYRDFWKNQERLELVSTTSSFLPSITLRCKNINYTDIR